jgi:Matrixin
VRSLILFSALAFSFTAAAFEVRKDSQGDIVRWTHSIELTMDSRIGHHLDESGAEKAIRAAVGALDEGTPELSITVVSGKPNPIGYTSTGTNTNSIVVLEDWPYSEEALAVTLVTLNARTNEMLDADVAFNVDQHRFEVLTGDSHRDRRNTDDIQNTLTHELGHVLGLMHESSSMELVMYPSAPPGEITKRQLKQDDLDGLTTLYGALEQAPATSPTDAALAANMGCSVAGAAPVWALVLPMLWLLRRRRAVALLTFAPAAVLASSPSQLVDRADDVALVEVRDLRVAVHSRNPGLILTTLELSSLSCLKGACGAMERVVVPGGRLGDLEQIVVHEPVPELGAQILVTRRAGKLRVLRATPDEQKSIIECLRGRSSGTQQVNQPPATSTQTPAITR